MGAISGEQAVDVAAPVDQCFAIAADLEASVRWQKALSGVDVHERDAEGRPVVASVSFDAKVRTITSRCRLAYTGMSAIAFEQERGDVKAMAGRWSFDELEAGLTRVTYALEVDPGRMLGLLLRGPGVVDALRASLLSGAADGLKREAEA